MISTSYGCHKVNQDTTCKVLQHEAVQVETAKAVWGPPSTEWVSMFEYLAEQVYSAGGTCTHSSQRHTLLLWH